MSHDNVESLNGVERNLTGATFQGFFESVERHLFSPLDGNSKDAVATFTGQGHFEFDGVVSYWQWIAGVHVVAAVENGFAGSENSSVRLNHRFDNIPVDFPRTLVRLNADLVVVDVTSWHRDLEVIGTKQNRATVATDIGSSRADESRSVGERGRPRTETQTESSHW